MLVTARLKYVAESEWELRHYLDVTLLDDGWPYRMAGLWGCRKVHKDLDGTDIAGCLVELSSNDPVPNVFLLISHGAIGFEQGRIMGEDVARPSKESKVIAYRGDDTINNHLTSEPVFHNRYFFCHIYRWFMVMRVGKDVVSVDTAALYLFLG